MAGLGSALGFSISLDDGLLWGAVVGGVVAGIPDFMRSGAVLTQSEHRLFNLAVGLIGGVLFLGVFAALVLLLLNVLI
jgi:hypothetical protein